MVMAQKERFIDTIAFDAENIAEAYIKEQLCFN